MTLLRKDYMKSLNYKQVTDEIFIYSLKTNRFSAHENRLYTLLYSVETSTNFITPLNSMSH